MRGNLVERIERAISIAELCHVRGKSPHDIYNLAAEAVTRIKELEYEAFKR